LTFHADIEASYAIEENHEGYAFLVGEKEQTPKTEDFVLKNIGESNPDAKCWNPDVYFRNAVSISEDKRWVQAKSGALKTDPIIVAHCSMTQANFRDEMQLRTFPFDFQDLTVIVRLGVPIDVAIITQPKDTHYRSKFTPLFYAFTIRHCSATVSCEDNSRIAPVCREYFPSTYSV